MSAAMTKHVDVEFEPTLPEAFADWMEELDRLVLARTEFSLHDLPDMRFFDAWDAGVAPDEFFYDEVVDHLADLGWEAE